MLIFSASYMWVQLQGDLLVPETGASYTWHECNLYASIYGCNFINGNMLVDVASQMLNQSLLIFHY